VTLRAGDAIELDCDDLDDEGAGVGTHAGARVHLAFALPGERVAATLTHVSAHRPQAWARLDRVEIPSPARGAPACAAFGACGGCVLQHMDVEAQLAWKATRLGRALGAHIALAGVTVAPGVPSPRPLGYRNRAKLVCARDEGGAVLLGAFAPRSHDVVDLAGCRLSEAPLETAADELRRLLATAGVAPSPREPSQGSLTLPARSGGQSPPALRIYDERTLSGDLRHVVLRSNHAGQVLAIFVVARPDAPGVAELARALRAALPNVSGVVENVNRTRGNVIFGDEDRVLEGEGALEERVGDVRLRLSPRAFFQANRDVAALAYAAIARELSVRPGERVVDAYGGVGGIALTLARAGAQVLGIEEHGGATADATASAALNDVPSARFVTGDVAVRLREVDRADVVVLNPPRKGCAPAALAEVARLRPRAIAYLSCDPDTLARDLAALVERGHRVRSVTPFDMMPHTPHVEALAVLERL
jgi:23S rRNA (uracil1939-C5)-methyltransferase